MSQETLDAVERFHQRGNELVAEFCGGGCLAAGLGANLEVSMASGAAAILAVKALGRVDEYRRQRRERSAHLTNSTI